MSDPTVRPGTQPLAFPPRRLEGAPSDKPSVAGQLAALGQKATAVAGGATGTVQAGGAVLEGLGKAVEGDVLAGGVQAAKGLAAAVEGARGTLDHLGRIAVAAGQSRLLSTAVQLRQSVGEATRVGRTGQGLSAGADAVSRLQGAGTAAGSVAEGLGKLAEGEALGGAVEAAQGSSEAVRAVAEAAGNVKKVGEALGGAEGRLARTASAIEQRVGDASRLGRTAAAAGGTAAVVAGAMHVAGGITQLREGKTLEGAAQAIGGVGEIAAGVGQAASAASSLAPGVAGSLAKVAGRLGPVVGAAAGAVQVATALKGNPEPDYKAAATGLMGLAGNALLPVPPVGTAVGGALVAGAVVLENWGTVSKALSGTGDAISRGWKALAG